MYYLGGGEIGLARGLPALTACPPGDSSNTRHLSARTNIWESVMKGLGEQEGASQSLENSRSALRKHNRKWDGCGKGSGEGVRVRTEECGSGLTPPTTTHTHNTALPRRPGRERNQVLRPI